MVLELAVLDVRAGQADDFEAAFAEATSLVASAPVFVALELRRCLEVDNRYVLLVRWQRLEDTSRAFGDRPRTSTGAGCCTTSATRSPPSSTTSSSRLRRRRLPVATTGEVVVSVDDPSADDVRALLERHLAFSRHVSPPGHDHALGVEALLGPAITLFGARRDGVLLGVGALRELDEAHGEIKSMHTAEQARGQGVGRAMVAHLLSVAAHRRYRRVSLETGTGEAFAAARALYTRLGFAPCEPFGDYTANPYSRCMTITL